MDIDSIKETMDEILSLGKKEQYKLLYLKFPGNLYLPETLLSKDILLIDRKVIYRKELEKEPTGKPQDGIHSYIGRKADNTLVKLSLESGKYSRFRLDPHFSPGIFEHMYSVWIDKSVTKEIADDVLVYSRQGNILGMLTYSLSSGCATIGLIAVDIQYQHMHLGSVLITALENIVYKKGVRTIEVPTQSDNIPACHFYEKNNYEVKEIINIYHIWL